MLNFSSWFYAFRTLFIPKGAKKDSGKIKGAVIGIVLSIIPIIIVLQVSSGMIYGITERFIQVAGPHLKLTSISNSLVDEKDDVINSVLKSNYVDTAYPTVESEAVLVSANTKAVVMFRGLPSNINDIDKNFIKYIEFISGSFDLEKENSIIISKDVAQKLSLKVGDEVKSLHNKIKFNRTIIGSQKFIVKGIFTTGYFEIDKILVYVNVNKAFEMFNDNSKSSISVKLKNPHDEELFYIEQDVLSKIDNANYSSRTWKEINRSLVTNLNDTMKMIIILSIIIIFVSSTNILSIMIMFQMEKRVDIAILKSCGVSENKIFNSFIFLSFLIGIIGTVIGITLGLSIAVNINYLVSFFDNFLLYIFNFFNFILGKEILQNNIDFLNKDYYLNSIPFVMKSWYIVLISFISILSAGIVGSIPALVACKIKPLKVMRKF